MAIFKVLAAEGFNQFTVIIGLLDFNREVMKYLIFLALLQSFLHIVVLHLIAFDIFDDLIRILLKEVAHIPLILLVCEIITVVPKSVALLIAGFKGFNFFNLGPLIDIKHAFELLEFLHLVIVAIELLSNLCELRECLSRQDLGLSQDFVIKSNNLLTNIVLLLLDLRAEISKVAIAGHFCLVLGLLKLNVQRLNLSCD